MEDSSTTTAPILDPIAGECWARLQLRSGIKDVSVASKPIKSLTLVEVVFIGPLAIPELNGRFLHDHWTKPEYDCRRLSGSTPATQRYKVHSSPNFIHDVTGLNRVECGRSQNSMEDSSTTTAPILDPIAGECSAQRQLHSGIKYVSVVPKLMKLLTTMRVVLIGPLAIPGLNGRFLHDRWTKPGSDCRRLSGSTPATQRYRIHPSAIFMHQVTVLNGVLAISEPDIRFLYNHSSDPGSDCGRLLGSTPAMQRYKVCPEATIPHRAIGSQEGG